MLGFHSNLKKRKVKRSFREDIEPHEVFLDRMAQKKEREIGISEGKIEVPLSKRMLQVFFGLVVLLFLAFFFKTFQLQVLEKDKYSALAESNKFIFYSIKANRGVVYDAGGEQLIFNKPGFDLVFDKEKISQEQKAKAFEEVAGIADLTIEQIEEKVSKGEDKVLILENIDHQTLILLETKIEELPGFEIEKRAIREYKDGKTFSHIIGYTGKITSEELEENSQDYSSLDFTGRSGVEKSYEKELKKKSGKIRVERDVLGNVISKEIISLPESGNSLKLWIKADLQRKIEDLLKKKLEEVGSQKAVAVALNPNNGGVLSLVSIPSFDNNLFSHSKEKSEEISELLSDTQQPLFNRVISGQYATGSTIKPLIATAALEENIISPQKTINCEGKITIPHRYDPEITYEYEDWTTHGITNLRKAIAESCNVYFYTIGGGYKDQEGLGPSKIREYLKLFNWGEKTGIDIPGENKGFIPSPNWKKEVKGEAWWDGDTYNLSIGQGDIAITPLQVATSFVAIANGGTLYQPQLVKAIIDSTTNEEREISAKVIAEGFVDSENLQIVREGMRKAVTGSGAPRASAVSLNSLPVAVAAKTGTASQLDNCFCSL